MKLFLPVFLLLFPFLAAAQLRIDVMDLIVNDVVYDPFSDRVYVSLPSENGANGNCIGVVNPYTFELEKAVFIGEEPTVVALSDDGQYLYVGFDGKPGAQRFDVVTQTLGPRPLRLLHR